MITIVCVMIIIEFFIFLLISKIQIRINYLEIDYKKFDFNMDDIDINIRLKLLNILPLINLKINNERLKQGIYKKYNIKNKVSKILFSKELNLKPKCVYFNLNVFYGIDDVMMNVYLMPIVSSFIYYLINNILVFYIDTKINYKVTPIYNRNIFKINLNCEFEYEILNLFIFVIEKLLLTNKLKKDNEIKQFPIFSKIK